MNVPKVVAFDLGKVLVDFDYGIAARGIAARGTMAAEEVKSFLDHSPLLFRFETGRISKEQFFDDVKSAAGFRGDLAEFSELFADIFTPIEPMLELHAALRAEGIPTYIFSNTNELAVGHIRRKFPFFGHFDGYILSYQHGAMKPETKLYEVVEQVTGHRHSEILYLDDRPENIAAGAARDWQVILQESPEKSWQAMRRSGLLNDA